MCSIYGTCNRNKIGKNVKLRQVCLPKIKRSWNHASWQFKWLHISKHDLIGMFDGQNINYQWHSGRKHPIEIYRERGKNVKAEYNHLRVHIVTFTYVFSLGDVTPRKTPPSPSPNRCPAPNSKEVK